MYTYTISGNLTYTDAETEDGLADVTLVETITIDEMNAEKALDLFLAKNPDHEFFGRVITCDAETRGKKGISLYDANTEQMIDVDFTE